MSVVEACERRPAEAGDAGDEPSGAEEQLVRAGQCESEGRVRRRHAAADGHGQGARGEHGGEDAGAEEWVRRWGVRCRPAVDESDLHGQSVQQGGDAAADEWAWEAMMRNRLQCAGDGAAGLECVQQ